MCCTKVTENSMKTRCITGIIKFIWQWKETAIWSTCSTTNGFVKGLHRLCFQSERQKTSLWLVIASHKQTPQKLKDTNITVKSVSFPFDANEELSETSCSYFFSAFKQIYCTASMKVNIQLRSNTSYNVSQGKIPCLLKAITGLSYNKNVSFQLMRSYARILCSW